MEVMQINGFAGWRKHRPPSLTRLPFRDLQPSTVLADSYIQGMVVTKWPIKKYKDSHLLKVIIQEVINDRDDPQLGSAKLQLFVIGPIVQEWDMILKEDYVCLSAVVVEGMSKHSVRVVVENNDQRVPRVWVIKKAVTLSHGTQNGSAAAMATLATRNRSMTRNGSASSVATSATRDRSTVAPVASATQNRSAADTSVTRNRSAANTSLTRNRSAVDTSLTRNRSAADMSLTWNRSAAELATKRQPLKQSYTYTLLKDIKPSTTVNVWGVIKFHKPPSKSRGLDYVQTISIADPSLTGEDEKIVCQMFAPRPDKLPNAVKTGQIIRLHRLKISTFNGKTQGGSGPGWSWLLFDSKTPSSTEPIASSSVTYSFSDTDSNKVVELRQWLMDDKCPVDLPENPSEPEPTNGHGTTEAEDVVQDAPTPAAAIVSVPVRSTRARPASSNLAATRLPAAVQGASAQPLATSNGSTTVPVTPRIGSAHHQAIVAKQLESLRASANTQKQQYQGYTSIKDLKHKSTVNVMGVIEFVKPIHRTVKREYLKVMSIVDQTSGIKLKCLLFTNQISLLPESTFVGQIICFHRLIVSTFNGEWQGQRGPGFAWTLFDARPGEAAEQVACSKDNRALDTIEKDKIFELQEWAENRGMLRYQRNKRISAIQPGEYFDLVCQVIGVRVEDPLKCMLLRVWDGSEPMIPLHQVNDSGKSLETNRTLEEQSYGMAVDVFVYDDHFRTAACLKAGDYVALTNLHAMRPRNVEAADREAVVPRVELSLHYGTTYSRGLHLIDPNTDLLAATVKEQLQDMAPSPSSGFSVPKGVDMVTRKRTRSSVPSVSVTFGNEEDDSQRIDHSPRQKMRRLDESASPILTRRSSRRLSSQGVSQVQPSAGGANKENVKATPSSTSGSEKPRCLQQSATVVVGHHHIKTTPLAEVVQHPAPYKFRIRVQLIEFQPKEPGSLYKLHCPSCHHVEDDQTSPNRESQRLKDPLICPKCSDRLSGKKSKMNDTLVLELLLADMTGWLRVHLWGDEAEAFFADVVSPSSPSAFTEILDELSQLCPPPSAEHYKRPWMECCIASYRALGETCFHMFDTMIAVNDD